jgi:hypothetical protein
VFAFVIRTSPVQTYLAQKATEFLSKELNTTIRIDKVSIVFIDRVALDGVFILDQQKDTLASIETIYVTLEELNLDKNFIKLGKTELEKGDIHINRDKITGDYNYWFITDYFSSGKSKSGKKPMKVSLNKLQLSDVTVKYDDYRKSYSTYGMDFDHIALKHVFLTAEDFTSDKGIVSAKITELKAIEKSGFILTNFSADASVSSKGIKVENAQIITPLSNIDLPKLHLLMNDYADIQTFVDSVTFDGVLAKSKVSLKDVSYFASNLEGMDQIVSVKGIVTNKVDNLKIANLDLRTGKKTIIQGTLNLPNFNELNKAFFNEKLDYAYISLSDLKKIKLPKSSKQKYLSFDKYLERLVYFQAKDFRLDGFYSQFVIAADFVKTNLGKVKIDNGIMFTENPKNNSYFFEKSEASDYDVKIEEFQLGKFLNDENFGVVDGTFFLSGEAFSTADIHFNFMEGHVNRFDYMDYSYNNIYISNGSFIDKVFIAKIDVKDDNLNLVYDGFIDFNGEQHMEFTVDLTKAILANLNITQSDSTSLTSNFTVNITGKTTNTMSGYITMNSMKYTEGLREIVIPSMTVSVLRGAIQDEFTIKSAVADVELKGKINFSTLLSDFADQFVKVFPSIVDDKVVRQKSSSFKSDFTYSIVAKDLNNFLAIFAPDIIVSSGTSLIGHYDGAKEDFFMDLNSSKIIYKTMIFEGVDFSQTLTSFAISADYSVDKFIYNDSISLDNVHFNTEGKQNSLNSELSWNPNTSNESIILWETSIIDNKNLNFILQPSFFSINDQRWEIENQSDFSISENEVHISKFKVQRNKQYISVDGCLSRNDIDKLNFKINDLDLKELGSLIGSDIKMEGLINGWGNISNPYTNLNYIGDATIQGLYINKEEVGDVFLQSEWNKASESVSLFGDLLYKGNQTFKFDGNYFLERETENLDFNLLFDQTDIQFANAFMDPDVVHNIKGLIDGKLKVTGTPSSPKLEGDVELIGGNAKIEILGVNFGFDGIISVDEYGFYIDNMPVTDEEGNTGALIGSVYHENYLDWNFDLQFDLENDLILGETPLFGFNSNTPIDKFLVLNTQYKEGDYYYGKAFVTGTANIFGYADNIEITVDLQTGKGTTVIFPMYGSAELDEEESFITFKKDDNSMVIDPQKIDFTGVDLNLNFRVTPDAQLQIIFNEQTGDEISTKGSGDISIKLDNLGDLTMDGTYSVKNGIYNFAMGAIKQPFYIQEGGTITWTGNPYNATLDLKTYYEVNAKLSEISPDPTDNGKNSSTQKVLCYLSLAESLMKPSIEFNIKAPKADEKGKALISRIVNDPAELSRQFFSLLLWKKFQPLVGSNAAVGGSAALDLVANQINSMLALVSKDYKLNVNLDAYNESGDNTYEFGVSKGFLNDRLIFNGSFGVENYTTSNQQSQNAIIGDVSLEYLLNAAGTFRVSIFNESNDYAIIQNKNLGPFTQGAGLHYQEDYDNFGNLKLLQHFFDIFRKKGNKKYPIKRTKRQTPVPLSIEATIFKNSLSQQMTV